MQGALIKTLPPGPRSHSFLYVAEICELQLWFKYGEKLKESPTEYMKFGAAFHDFRFRMYEHCRSIGRDTDLDSVSKIADDTFHDHSLPLRHWDEFEPLCRSFAESRPLNDNMRFEVRFGVNRDESWDTFETCDGFRGIVDGIEIDGDVGTITDAKTSRTMDIPFTQLMIYASFWALKYPEVKEWRLVYDFPRYGKIREKVVLAENLVRTRQLVWARIRRIERQSKFPAQPGEHCLTCQFFNICDYRLQGITGPESTEDVVTMIEDHFHSKARTAQLKRLIKTWVDEYGDVMTEKSVASFFDVEKKVADKQGLVKFLKDVGKDPLDFLDFTAGTLTKLVKDHELSDDVGNYITFESTPKFKIKKRRKHEEDSDEEISDEELL